MVLVPVPLSAAVVREAAEFFKQFGGIHGFLESLLNVPKGYVEQWASQNLIRWYDKLQAENAKRKNEGRQPIPPSLLMPALRQIAMEDDGDMLALWARLFANFQDTDRRLEPNKIYVHVLAEMQPLDAKLIHHVVLVLPEQQQIVSGDERRTPLGVMLVTLEDLARAIGVPEEHVLLSLHNLARLGCLIANSGQVTWTSEDRGIPEGPSIGTSDGVFYLTSLGRSLVTACEPADRGGINHGGQQGE